MAINVFLVFVTIIASGIPVTLSKFIAGNNVDKNTKKSNYETTSGVIIGLVTSIVLSIIIIFSKKLFILFFNDISIYYFILTLIPALISSGIYSAYKGNLWGNEKFFTVSIVEFIETLLKIICLLILTLVFNGNNLIVIGISISVGCVLSSIIGIYKYHKEGGRLEINKLYFKPVLKSSIPLTMVRVASSLMMPIISLVLTYQLLKIGYTNEQVLSQIGIALGMSLPLLTIPSTLIGSLSMAMIPKLSSTYKQKDNQSLLKQIMSSYKFTICCTFLAIIGFMSLGKEICLLLFNNNTAGDFIVKSAWVMLPMGISQLTTSMLNSLGLEVKTFKYYIWGSIFMIILIFMLPKYIGIYSLVFSLGGSFSLISILNIVKIKKTLNIKSNFSFILIGQCIITIPLTLLCKWTLNIINLAFPLIISVSISAILCIIIYILLCFVFGIIDINILKSMKLKRKSV